MPGTDDVFSPTCRRPDGAPSAPPRSAARRADAIRSGRWTDDELKAMAPDDQPGLLKEWVKKFARLFVGSIFKWVQRAQPTARPLSGDGPRSFNPTGLPSTTHIGAESGERLGAGRARLKLSEIDHPDAGETVEVLAVVTHR